MKELACLQDMIFQRYRHNRFYELQNIAAHPETSAMFLALHGRRISGFIHVRSSNRDGEWNIRGLGVVREYRRQGIAGILLDTAIKFIKSLEGHLLVSWIDKKNIPSRMLHERLGFRDYNLTEYPVSELRTRLALQI